MSPLASHASQREKELRLLAKYEKQRQKKKPRGYFWYMLLVLALIYIVDEVATNLPNSLETEINVALFGLPFIHANGFGLEQLNAVAVQGGMEPAPIFEALSQGLSWIGMVKLIANVTLIASMFYRPLADKYGRRIFLFVNTIGMAAALIVLYFVSNIWIYALGFLVLRFFVTPDQQVIYLVEISPEKRRGTLLSITKGLAEFGLVLMWLLRRIFLQENVPSSYRSLFLVISVAAAAIAFITRFCSRESDVFLDEKIAYLKKTPEERAKEKEVASKAQGGFFAAIKYTMKNKQLRWIMIVTAIVEIAYSCCNNYSNVLSNGVLGVGFLNQAQATEVGFFFPFSCAIVTMIYGYFADRFGRKPTSIGLLVLATLGFVGEFVALYFGWPLAVVGIFLGIVLGADWANGDLYAMMATESSATNLRASVMSVWSLFFGVGMVLSMGICALLPALVGKANLSIGYFLVAVPAWVVALILLQLKVQETKGADLKTVGKED